MKLKLVALGFISALLLAVLLIVNAYRSSSPAYILAQYPHEPTFDNIVYHHLDNPTQSDVSA